MSGKTRHVVIIGNGIAGVTAARYLRKLSDDHVTIISAETEHFYSRPALMYIFMGHMEYAHTKPYEDWFWKKNRIDLVFGKATHIDVERQLVHVANDVIRYDELILATGAHHNMFGWPGEDLHGVQGLTNVHDVESLEKLAASAKRAVIVGGGLIGVEAAEMLRSRGIDVTFLVREELYWNNVLPTDEANLVGRHIVEHGVDLQLETELKEILDDGNGNVAGVVTSRGEKIECSIVVISAGVSPRIDLAKESHIPCERGILVNDFFETQVPHIHAVGDCAQRPNRRIDLLWYTGRAHGERVARNLCETKAPYVAEDFYNSAKFFDVEYQTYGLVPRDVDNDNCFVWKGADGRRFLRIVHYNGRVTGFNALGLRLRGEQCLKWINEEATLDSVMKNLMNANFDPEFFTTVKEIQKEAA